MPMPSIPNDFDQMERNEAGKAYRQGYSFGKRRMKISQADWEKEFLPFYNAGHKDGMTAPQD